MARGRGKASPQDKEALRIISEKIRELLKEQGKTVSKSMKRQLLSRNGRYISFSILTQI